jgi:hypothetical protein
MTRRSWIAAAIAFLVVFAVVGAIAGLWASLGESEISLAGWVAMGLGVTVTLALGIALMTLVFISSRRGYDELGRRDP